MKKDQKEPHPEDCIKEGGLLFEAVKRMVLKRVSRLESALFEMEFELDSIKALFGLDPKLRVPEEIRDSEG